MPDNAEAPMIELPESIKEVMLTASTPSMVIPCLEAFISLTTSRSARYDIEICTTADDTLMSKTLAHLLQPTPDPPKEFHVAPNAVVALSPPEWAAGDPEIGIEWVFHGVFTFDLQRWFALGEVENNTLGPYYHRYLSSARLETIERLSIASSAICSFFDDDVLKTTFARATKVSGLAVPYAPALCHLLCALEVPASEPTVTKEMALFPALKVVALYPYMDNYEGDVIDIDDVGLAQLRIGLPNFLHVRKEAGHPIEKLRIEKSVLDEADIQGLKEMVTVELL